MLLEGRDLPYHRPDNINQANLEPNQWPLRAIGILREPQLCAGVLRIFIPPIENTCHKPLIGTVDLSVSFSASEQP